jgi:hypothetical protein
MILIYLFYFSSYQVICEIKEEIKILIKNKYNTIIFIKISKIKILLAESAYILIQISN